MSSSIRFFLLLMSRRLAVVESASITRISAIMLTFRI